MAGDSDCRIQSAYTLEGAKTQNTNQESDKSSNSVSFANIQEEKGYVPTNFHGKEIILHNITCWRCKKKGHYANECPDGTGTTMLHYGDEPLNFIFNQNGNTPY